MVVAGHEEDSAVAAAARLAIARADLYMTDGDDDEVVRGCGKNCFQEGVTNGYIYLTIETCMYSLQSHDGVGMELVSRNTSIHPPLSLNHALVSKRMELCKSCWWKLKCANAFWWPLSASISTLSCISASCGFFVPTRSCTVP